MRSYPTTLEEAQKYRYSKWAGFPQGRAYDPARCAYEVWQQDRGATHYQCQRSNGHGPNGLYCATHAAKVENALGLSKKSSRYIFVAEFGKYGTPALSKVGIGKESPKTFIVENSERLLGSIYLGNRINKERDHWFDSGEAALDWLIERADAYVERCAKNLEEAKAEAAKLKEIKAGL